MCQSLHEQITPTHIHIEIKTILRTGYFLGMHYLRFLHNRIILKEGIDRKNDDANTSTSIQNLNIYLHILTVACLIKCIYFVLVLCDIFVSMCPFAKKPFVITERWSCLCWNVICSLCSHGNKHDMAKKNRLFWIDIMHAWVRVHMHVCLCGGVWVFVCLYVWACPPIWTHYMSKVCVVPHF